MKKNKVGKDILRVLLLAVCGLVLGLNIYSANAKSLVGNHLPMPFGYGAAVVLSGSMEPTLSVGDLILVNPKSEHVDEAMEFVLWYIQGGMAPLASGGRIPLWRGFDANLIVDALCQTEGVFNVDSIKAFMSIEKTKAYATIASDVDSKIATIKKEEMQAALYGQKSVEEACADMKARADELLK